MNANRIGTGVLERAADEPPDTGEAPRPRRQRSGGERKLSESRHFGGFTNWLAARKASRLVTILAIITIGPLVALSTITITSSHSALSNSAEMRLVDNSSLLGVFVATTLVATGIQIETATAGRPDMAAALADGNHANFNDAAINRLVKDARYIMPAISRAFVTDAKGRYWGNSDPAVPAPPAGTDYSSQDWYRGIQRTGGAYTSTGFITSGAKPQMSIAIAVPIFGDGRDAPPGTVVGFLVGVYPQGTPDALFAGYPGQQPVDIQLTDQKGYIVESSFGTPTALVRDDSDGVAAALRGRHTTTRLDLNGTDSFAAYAPVPLIGWTVRASVPASAALSDANELLNQVLVIGLILLALMLLTKVILYLVLRNMQSTRSELATANATLERRVAARTAELEEFSFSVSHDLRAPLRSIDGFTRLVVEEDGERLSAQSIRRLAKVHDSVQQMGQLIDELLGFSRLSHVEFRKERVEPTEMVTEVMAELGQDQPSRTIELNVGPLPPCRADPARLTQVLRNLLNNAVNFTSPRDVARIEVGSTPTVPPDDPRMVTYFVKDNGVGFDMRYADKLFEPFERLHSPKEFSGTGVGLALVKRIVERHGGRVWAEGAIDVGATFYFTLEGDDAGSTD